MDEPRRTVVERRPDTVGAMERLARAVDELATATAFSGVVRIDRGDEVELARAYGLAHRAHAVPNTLETQFAIASGAKGLTALTVMSLVEDGTLTLATPARALLGDDLPLIGDGVTVEHLLAHRSGIGDYLDEEEGGHDVEDYVMPVPVHELAATEDYLRVLDGHRPKFAPGDRFSYCNSGYVVLALLAERASGVPFHELVRHRVCERAELRDTEFLRSDELPRRAALGYLRDGRTNVFHLPVRGSGDGGVYTTATDAAALWQSLFAGRIVTPDALAEMTRPRSAIPRGSRRYGLGLWLDETGEVVMLEGSDAGVSFRSAHAPRLALTYTVVSNTSGGAWPLVRLLADELAPRR